MFYKNYKNIRADIFKVFFKASEQIGDYEIIYENKLNIS